MTRLAALDEVDAAAVCRWVRSRPEVVVFGGPRLPWPLTPGALLDVPRGHQVLGWWHGDDLVATGQLWPVDTGTVRMGRLLVDPAQRGRGHGGHLVADLLERARDEWPAASTISLGVFRQNTSARDLYERLGFTDTGERTWAVVDGQRWESVQMTRALR